jgi:hypothetical protein
MDKPRIRAAIAADVPAIAQIVDHAYRHYIARMGKPPGPMLEDYTARVSEGVVWVLEEGAVIAAIIVLLPALNYLLLRPARWSGSRRRRRKAEQSGGTGLRVLPIPAMRGVLRESTVFVPRYQKFESISLQQ